MQELGTDTNLYALVFGESVLNDAVSFCHYVIDIPYSCRVHVLVKGKSCLLGDFFFFFWYVAPLVDGNFFVQVRIVNYTLLQQLEY